MGKLVVSRQLFDAIIGDFRDGHEFHSDYFHQVSQTLEIRNLPQVGFGLETVYVDFGGKLDTARAFAEMYGIDRKTVLLARNIEKIEGRRVRLKPVNLDYEWSLLNWNHDIHVKARDYIYRHEAMYGSV